MTKVDFALILDNGSASSKSGIAGDNVPRSVIPSIIGKSNHLYLTSYDYYLGNELKNKGFYKRIQLIENGIIKHFDDIEKLWHFIFYNELRVEPEEHPVLLTEAPLNPKANREKMTQIMFESFSLPNLYIAIGEVLSLYQSGRTNGIVLESGDQKTHLVQIYDGNAIQPTILRSNLAGRDLTEYMMKILTKKGYSFNNKKDEVQDIKEKFCFVSPDFNEDLNIASISSNFDKLYELPDGCIITAGVERFLCPEVLFKPSLFDNKHKLGIHEMIYNSIEKADNDIKNILYSNIILSGGSTMFKGIKERVTKEVSNLVTNSVKIKVIAQPERLYSSWIGGSILASLSTFQQMCVSKKEFDEFGAGIVHRKCF
jgi:actin